MIDTRLTYADVTRRVVAIPLGRTSWTWLSLFGFAMAASGLLAAGMFVVLTWGVGVWGVDIPVAWGFAIINFVWWIGIGHAGTLISAILLLLRQDWRTSINRFAEAMTLFAVANAGLFPLLHLGRQWKFYYLLPYPDTLGAWPQWRSPLVWDIFAVLTYFTVSLIFWYVGLLPDLATLRDIGRSRRVKRWAGLFSLGWRGDATHWQRYQSLYLLLAGLATPLVVSVHSIVSLDFAVGIVPGWHTTVFPPYFVAGAIYSGFAMVFVLALPLRTAYGLKDLITTRHLNAMGKVMLASGLIVAYGYLIENFSAFFSNDKFEIAQAKTRWFGPYAVLYWGTLICNVAIGNLLWFRWVRVHALPLFLVSAAVLLGMWLERFVIIAVSLHRDYVPAAWGMYYPTIWDWALLLGSLAFFLLLFLLFIRLVPMIAASEVRELLHEVGRPATVTLPTELPAAANPPDQPSNPQGAIAAFLEPHDLVTAVRRTRQAGYSRLNAYTPFPVQDLPQALGLKRTRVPLFVLLGGLAGAIGAFYMQYYSATVSYPWNIGGRPLNSWPSFIPLTFELGVLGGALCGLLAMLIANRLPQLYHPILNAPGFERASQDRFLLSIEAADPRFDSRETLAFLHSLQPEYAELVPARSEAYS